MNKPPPGLLGVSTGNLRTLADAIKSDALACPITEAGLVGRGLERLWDRLALLHGASRETALAVVNAVLAEREQGQSRRTELVWTGPDVDASTVRDTGVVVKKLFEEAKESVLVAGYSFDHGKDILAPLHEAMRDRGVTAEIFLHLDPVEKASHKPEAHASRQADYFLRDNWPFGEPKPTLYYDPRTVAHRSRASLHAKCIVLDEETLFLGSANFTQRGQTRNIEIGLVLRDPQTSRELVHQWRHAVTDGTLRRVT